MMAIGRIRRLHLTRLQGTLLAVAAFIVLANLYVFATQIESRRQRDVLATQVTTIERQLQRLRDRGVVPGGLAPPLEAGENPFPRDIGNSDLTNLVVQAAQASGVQVLTLTPIPSNIEKLVQGNYRATRQTVKVSGASSQIADFLVRIERGLIRTWVIDNTRAIPVNNDWEIGFDLTAYSLVAGP